MEEIAVFGSVLRRSLEDMSIEVLAAGGERLVEELRKGRKQSG